MLLTPIFKHDTICRIRLLCWRMKTSADQGYFSWQNLKADIFMRVYSIIYTRVRACLYDST